MKKLAIVLLLILLSFTSKLAGQCSVTSGSATQTICDGQSITSTSFYLADATGATASGLPAGVTMSFDAPTFTATISGTPTVTGSVPYSVTLTHATTPCTSNGTITINPVLAASVSISAGANPVCEGTSVTFTATPTNGGGSPAYQWYKGATPVGSGGSTYSYIPVNGDQISVVMTSGETCVSGSPATSNTITMTVNTVVAAGVSISAGANPVCAGTSVTFTATPTNGGGSPAYQWYKGATPVGSGGSTYSYIPVNGDQISVVMTSGETCVSGSPATSNTITMTVNTVVAAGVSISAGANPVCAGTSVTFTATPTNGGGSPAYQWYKGATPVGSGGSTYSYTPVNGDQISVVMTSGETCVSGSPATSNTVTMTVNPNLPVSVTIAADANPSCDGATVNFTATPVNGGTPSYQWYVGSSPVGTNSPAYSYVPVTGDAVSVVMSSSLTCKSGSPATSNTVNMTVNPLTGTPVFVAGPASVCNSDADATYTATADNSLSISYSRSPSTSGSINSSTGVMNWSSSFSGIATITATASGLCGITTENFYVTVYGGVPTRPASVTGSSVVCQGQTGVIYTCATSANTTFYEWTVPAGATLVSGQGTTSIVVDFSPTATNLSVSVRSQNNCGLSSSARSLAITVRPTPTATISGSTTVCQGAASPNIRFTNPMDLDVTITYNINGANQTTVNVSNNDYTNVPVPTATAGTYTYILVSVAYSTGVSCPNSLTGTATVTVTPTVGTPAPITVSAGSDPTCQLTNGTTSTSYTTTASNSTSLTWSLSSGSAGTINPSTGVMTWANGFYGSVDIRVVANGCGGPSAMVTRPVSVTQTVGTPAAITISGGSEPACQLPDGSTTTTYSTTAANSTGFNWSLSNGTAGFINPSTGVMNWASGFSGSVNIQVTASGCGTSSMVTRTVNITPNVGTPAAITITSGSDPVCQLTNGTTTTDYHTSASNSTGYTWSISNPAAGSIDPATGLMAWANGFSGNVDIQVYATGCNGNSAQVTRPVSITPAVGTPTPITIAAGNDPNCQLTAGTTVTIYATTATNSTGFTWSVSDAAAGTINSSTGYMTWNNGWSGNVDIRVVASGCGTSAQVVRPVTIHPLPAITISGNPSPRVNSTGNTYTTQPGMSSYLWTLSGGGTGIITSEVYNINWSTTGNQTLSVTYTDTHGCTAVSPAVFNVDIKPLPAVSGVTISGYPAVGNTLTGSYSYTDGNSGTNVSTVRWLRNGTVEVGTSLTYVPTADDINKTLVFEVTPVSTVGPPYTGTVVKSSPTELVEDLTGKPVADEVCIEGIRAPGNTLRGEYRYTFSKTEGISTYKWYLKDLITGTSVVVGTNRLYTLVAADISDTRDIIFEVTPVSSNLTPIQGDPVLSNPLARILIPKAEFSVSEPDVTLSANEPGGVFSGSGVSGTVFSPNSAGSAGSPHTLTYLLNIVNTSSSCSQQASKIVTVNPNVSSFVGFDPLYCKDGGQDIITVSGMPTGASIIGFSTTNNKGIVSQTGTTVTIDPALMRPGINKDYLYFSYNHLGVFYQISQPFNIDSVGTDIRLINLEDAYCEGDARKYISVEGVYPIGGTADWTGAILTDMRPSSAYAEPALGIPGATYPVTYRYRSPAGCYSKLLSQSININPLPDPSFALDSTYNIDGGPVTLLPVQGGGTFSGSGVSGNKLFPDLAGLGEYEIRYLITDTNNCVASLGKKTLIRKAQGIFADIPGVICYSDSTYNVKVNGLPDKGLVITGFTNTKNTLVHVPGAANAAYNVPAAGPGEDTLTFTYKWDGVDYSISKPLLIDSLGQVLIKNLADGQAICDNLPSFELNPSILGGAFTGPMSGNYLDPKKALGPVDVSYTYINTKTGCSTSVKVPIVIYPAPVIAFAPADVCIDDKADTTFFLNNTTSADAIQSWLWEFTDAGSIQLSTAKDGGYLYKSGGLQKVALTGTTVNGCSATKESTFNLGVKPLADFYWKNDCMHPDDNLILVDTTFSTSQIVSRSWRIFNGAEFSTAAKTALYPKTGTGYIKVEYIVRTSYANCNDTVLKDIFIRPTIPIQTDGYFENFEAGMNGWVRGENESVNTWTFGTPDRQVINQASSGQNAWYTGFDRTVARSETSSIVSPCFDFTAIERPVIKLKLWKQFVTERDGAVLQYKVGDLGQWQSIGTIGTGINWYNSAVIRGEPGGNQLGWTTLGAPDQAWTEAIHTLNEIKGEKDVKLRIAYGTDGTYPDHDGMAFDDIWIGERSRNVLLEHFTNLSSTASSEANAIINKITGSKTGDVVNIQYHTNFPGSDPFYQANPGDASARILFYGLTRAPYTFIDGGTKKNFANIFDNDIAKIDSNDVTKRSLIASRFKIEINPEISGGVLTVRGSLRALENIQTENLTLFIAVTEKRNTRYTGAAGETEFLNVFRKFIPDAGGILLKNNWTQGETYNISEQAWTIEKVLNNTDIEVIVFLQNSITKEVFQAVSVIKPSIVVGIENPASSAGFSFSLYPNPAVNKITIQFDEPLNRDSELRFFDIRGAPVRHIEAGAGTRELSINDLGLKPGIYLVRFYSGGLDYGFRKLVVTGN